MEQQFSEAVNETFDQANAQAKPTNDDVIEMSGDILAAICLAHGLPVDFDGVTISLLREPKTNRLLAAILSPVDMHAGEPYARYQVNPDHIAAPKAPKLILPAH